MPIRSANSITVISLECAWCECIKRLTVARKIKRKEGIDVTNDLKLLLDYVVVCKEIEKGGWIIRNDTDFFCSEECQARHMLTEEGLEGVTVKWGAGFPHKLKEKDKVIECTSCGETLEPKADVCEECGESIRVKDKDDAS